MDNLTELLEDQVKDLYSAENQILKALPRMAKKASSPELKAAFLQHAQETQGQVERILQVAELLGIKPGGKLCAATKGLVEEGKEIIEEDGHPTVIDAGLIAAAQRIEHYEIAAYGTARAIAEVLGNQQLVDLFDETLAEEEATDEKLSGVAEALYPNAPKSEDDHGEEDEDDETPASGGKGKSSATSSRSSAGASSGSRGAAGKTAAAAKGGRSTSGASKAKGGKSGGATKR